MFRGLARQKRDVSIYICASSKGHLVFHGLNICMSVIAVRSEKMRIGMLTTITSSFQRFEETSTILAALMRNCCSG